MELPTDKMPEAEVSLRLAFGRSPVQDEYYGRRRLGNSRHRIRPTLSEIRDPDPSRASGRNNGFQPQSGGMQESCSDMR